MWSVLFLSYRHLQVICVSDSHSHRSRCSLCGRLRKRLCCRTSTSTAHDKEIMCPALENSCFAVMWSGWRISRSDPVVACWIILYACLMMNVPLYRAGIAKSILLKLKQYRVLLIRCAKSKWGGFDTSLQDSSLPSNDTLSILALHW